MYSLWHSQFLPLSGRCKQGNGSRAVLSAPNEGSLQQSGGLAALGRLKRLDSYLCDPVSRKLGDVSYSLYLIHMPALVMGISLGSRIFETSAVGSTGIFAVAMGSALLLSFLFWNFIERPSHELAKRIRPGRDRSRLPLAQGDFVHNPPG